MNSSNIQVVIVFVRSDKISVCIEIIPSTGSCHADMILQFDLVSQESAYSSESLHKLESLLRFVCDELQLRSKLRVVGAEPLGKRLSLDQVVRDLSVSIAEELLVLFLSGCKNEHLCVSLDRMLEHKSVSFDVFEQHKCLKCAQF